MAGFIEHIVALDENLRNRVILFGGKVAGVECSNCEFDGRGLNFKRHTTTEVYCPDCGTTLLTAGEKSQLRQADKL